MSYYNGSSYTFTWKDGRRLATLIKGNTSVSYKYNSDGIRYEKTVNGIVHKYYLMGSTITAETIIDGNTTTYIEYFYDSYGPYGFSIDGTFYYYVKNLQGDVTQIRDENNNLIASYVYDAWGKVLSVTENTAYNIGAKNAIRYRGYYYDTESNLYYLNARYYDPQIKRFINPDAILGANGDIIGYNMYAYCNNNPIAYYDKSGLSLDCLRPDDYRCGGEALILYGLSMVGLFTVSLATYIATDAAVLEYPSSIVIRKNREKIREYVEEKDISIPAPPKISSTTIYRYFSSKTENLAPRKGKDYDGLSFSTIPPRPGVSAVETTIEQIDSTGILKAYKTSSTHVVVVPINGNVKQWMEEGMSSSWSQALSTVVIEWGG